MRTQKTIHRKSDREGGRKEKCIKIFSNQNEWFIFSFYLDFYLQFLWFKMIFFEVIKYKKIFVICKDIVISIQI